MKGKNISFRLSMPALAKGLLAIRLLEPTYKPASIHKMVQLIYYDYCSKMAMGHTDEIPPEITAEIMMLIGIKKKVSPEKDKEILERLNELSRQPMQPDPELYPSKVAMENNSLTNDIVTESKSSTVEDFSFLAELVGEEENNNE